METKITCAKCGVPVQGPDTKNDDDIFGCPECGESDTLKNILEEVKEGVKDQMADNLAASFKRIVKNDGPIKMTFTPRENKPRRFVADLKL